MIIDIIFIAILATGAYLGAKKGLIKSVWSIGAWILTIILVKMMAEPVCEIISNTSLYISMRDTIFDKISQKGTEGFAFIPQSIITDMAGDAVGALSDIIARALSYIILIIAIRLLLSVVFIVVDLISKLPVISGANKLTGAIIGVVNALIISVVILSLISVLGIDFAILGIQDSVIVKYLYNNNILLNLFI